MNRLAVLYSTIVLMALLLALIGPVYSYVLNKQQLTLLDNDRQTIIARGPGGLVGLSSFGTLRTNASLAHVIYLWNTGTQDFWIVQTPAVSSLAVVGLPLDASCAWNITMSFKLTRGSSSVPVLLVLKSGTTEGSFDFQVTISVYQTPRG